MTHRKITPLDAESHAMQKSRKNLTFHPLQCISRKANIFLRLQFYGSILMPIQNFECKTNQILLYSIIKSYNFYCIFMKYVQHTQIAMTLLLRNDQIEQYKSAIIQAIKPIGKQLITMSFFSLSKKKKPCHSSTLTTIFWSKLYN